MIGTTAALLPVFLVIALGYGLYRTRLAPETMWSALEHVCYFLLFPCLIIKTLSTADFSKTPLGGLTAGFLITLILMALALIAARPLLKSTTAMTDQAFTSLFQGVMRWHGFMALAIVTALYGEAQVPIVAVAIAVMVPLLNVLSVSVLAIWGASMGAAKPPLLRQLVRNPFIIACATGGALNVSGIGLPEPLFTSVSFLAGGALGLSLLSVGAGLRPGEISAARRVVAVGVVARLVIMPLMMFIVMTAMGVSGEPRTIAVICGAVPTAASAYVLARQMGGDAPLMANIITIQILVAAFTLPTAIWLAGG